MSKMIRVSDEIHTRLKIQAVNQGQTLYNVTTGLLGKGLNAKRKSTANGDMNPIQSGHGWVTGVNGERVEIASVRRDMITGYFISDDGALVFNNGTNFYSYNQVSKRWVLGIKDHADYII